MNARFSQHELHQPSASNDAIVRKFVINFSSASRLWLYNFQEHRWKHVNKQWLVAGRCSNAILTGDSSSDAQVVSWKGMLKRPQRRDFAIFGRHFFLLGERCSSCGSQAARDNLVGCAQVLSSFWCDINHFAIGRMLDMLNKIEWEKYFFSPN